MSAPEGERVVNVLGKFRVINGGVTFPRRRKNTLAVSAIYVSCSCLDLVVAAVI